MATRKVILTERELTDLIKKIIRETEETSDMEEKGGGSFGWIKKAAREIASLFRSEILPEIPEDELDELKDMAVEIDPKSAINELPHFASSEEGELALAKAEERLGENTLTEAILTEGLSDRVLRILSKAGVFAGIGISGSGLMTYASNILGYVDSDFLRRVHEIVEPYCSAFCGPLGLVALILGALLAIGSYAVGYNRRNK